MNKVVKFFKTHSVRLLASTLALIMGLYSVGYSVLSGKNELTSKVRTIQLADEQVDSEAFLNSFEDTEWNYNGSTTTFTGSQTLSADLFEEIDNVSAEDIEQAVGTKVTYTVSYDSENNEVSLLATLENENGEVSIDKITGVAFTNENGDIDAVLDMGDGEYVFLSELRDAGLIQNCGWFKKLIIAAVAAVAVAAVVAAVMVTGGAALGAVVAVCAGVGALAGGAASAIVGACDGEVSFGEIAGNFGAGMVVGAICGAITGFCVGYFSCGSAAKYSVGYGKGSFSSVGECVEYHFTKHGAEVGAKSVSEYIRLAIKTAREVIMNGAAPVRAVGGATAGVMRYEIGGYYIHMAIDGLKIIIVSFGAL